MNTRPGFALISVFGLFASAGLALGQGVNDVPHPAPAAQAPAQAGQPATNAPATGRSQLVFETLEHDFGRISDQKSVDFNFKFKNTGDAALKFTAPPHPSCGCTAGNPRSEKSPDKDQMEFAPGEEGYIKVTYNPQGKHGDVNQRVTLNTNDPQQPEQVLKIHAFVKTTVAFDPPLVSFGDVRTRETAKQFVKVNGPAPDFKVTYASCSKGRYIEVKVLDTKTANVEGEEVSQSTLELTFNGTAPRGTMQAVTTIRTNNEQFPLADLQVMAEVVGDLQVLPPRVNVGIIDGGQTFTKVFRVNSRSGKPFHITNVSQKTQLPQQLEINVTPVEPGNETAYQVEVKGQGPATASPISATITLATDNPSDKTIDVMLNGAVRPPQPMPQATPQGQTPQAQMPQGTPGQPMVTSPQGGQPTVITTPGANPKTMAPATKPAEKTDGKPH